MARERRKREREREGKRERKGVKVTQNWLLCCILRDDCSYNGLVCGHTFTGFYEMTLSLSLFIWDEKEGETERGRERELERK